MNTPDHADLREEVSSLRERVAELEDLVAELTDDAPSTAGYGDSRDQAVIAVLNPGERVPLKRLQALYRRETDIRNGATLKERVKALTQDGPFERVATQAWRYTGDRDE